VRKHAQLAITNARKWLLDRLNGYVKSPPMDWWAFC
jgi:hypothetical protein